MATEPVDPQKSPIEEQESEEMNSNQELTVDELEHLQNEVSTLRDELAASQAKAEEYLDGWQRALADFANYKKRVERDRELLYQTTSGSIVKRYLEVMDDLERALKNKPQQGEGAAWAGGIEMIYRKLKNILEAEGVKEMDVEGKQFDPNLHEAVTSEDSDSHDSGEVIEVLQKGYLMGDRVLRPAMVRVAR